MNTNSRSFRPTKFIQYVTLFLALLVALGTIIWVSRYLPYVSNPTLASVKRISRIVIEKDDDYRFIYDLQLNCQHPDAKSITCQHDIAGRRLAVQVQPQKNRNYLCSAQFADSAVDCTALPTYYTHGGATTPYVRMPISDAEFNAMGPNYGRLSLYNLQAWLTFGYLALAFLLLIQCALLLWRWVGNRRVLDNADNRVAVQAGLTALTMIPTGIVLYFLTLFVLLLLYLVD